MEKLKRAIPAIEKKFNYTFKDKDLLILAFTHRSYANEHKDVKHYERLEFLGDSVLGMLIAEYLYHTLPDKMEGELSALRARLIQASSCVQYAQHLQMKDFILLGKGEKLNAGRGRDSILSDVFEAILGAIYLDGGYQEAKNFFFQQFKSIVDKLTETPSRNWKALLQDICQKNYQNEPVYTVLSVSGPDHNKHFVVAVKIQDITLGMGEGSSIKNASQEAARNAIKHLEDLHGS